MLVCINMPKYMLHSNLFIGGQLFERHSHGTEIPSDLGNLKIVLHSASAKPAADTIMLPPEVVLFTEPVKIQSELLTNSTITPVPLNKYRPETAI